MATIKSYSDLQQSKKLAEILPIESADMYWMHGKLDNVKQLQTPNIIGNNHDEPLFDDFDVPCWSLASLLEEIPYEMCDDNGNSAYLQIDKEDEIYQLVYKDPYGDFESIETDRYEHFVDACVAMIEKLHKLKML